VRDLLQEVDQSATVADPNADPSKIRTTYSYDNLGNLARVLRRPASARGARSTTGMASASATLLRLAGTSSLPHMSTTSVAACRRCYRRSKLARRARLVFTA
jgi:hypothetical protein